MSTDINGKEIDINGRVLMALIELNMYLSMNAKGDNCVPGSDLQKGCEIIVESRQFTKSQTLVKEALDILEKERKHK